MKLGTKPEPIIISNGDKYEIRETPGGDGITVRLVRDNKPGGDAAMVHMPAGNVVQISPLYPR